MTLYREGNPEDYKTQLHVAAACAQSESLGRDPVQTKPDTCRALNSGAGVGSGASSFRPCGNASHKMWYTDKGVWHHLSVLRQHRSALLTTSTLWCICARIDMSLATGMLCKFCPKSLQNGAWSCEVLFGLGRARTSWRV